MEKKVANQYSYCQLFELSYNIDMISYAHFWWTLQAKGISTYALINRYNISSGTIDRMQKGNGISTLKVDDFCRILDCRIEDIIEYVGE